MFTTRPELLGTFGMISSTHWLASLSGMAVLEAGGNAFDAAVAAGLVLQVVEPHRNGPGGEVPILLYSRAEDKLEVINGQGPAPSSASIDAFKDLGLDIVPGTGLLAACVPGAFDAWMRLLAERGTMRLGEVMKYAIGYAEKGYPVMRSMPPMIATVEELFKSEWHSSADVYLPSGRVPRVGSILRNSRLAETYRRIVNEAERATSSRENQIHSARDQFYRGFVAELISEYVSSTQVLDTSGRRHAGLLVADDMVAFKAETEAPASYDYKGYTVCKTGPWGQGPVFLQQLSLLKGFDISAMENNGPDFIHTVVESAKLAFADREAWYGDPRFVDVPLNGLLEDEYVDARRKLITDAASSELRPGSIGGRFPVLGPETTGTNGSPVAGVGEPMDRRADIQSPPHSLGPADGDTSHVAVVDRYGNLVSATPSGAWLQSSPVIPSLGFPLGTRAQMFWVSPGHPSSLAGGKRPRTTLSPSLALRDGKPYMAFGTPGGDKQDQWSLIFFLKHVHFGLNLQEAIDSPLFHTTHFPSSFFPRNSSPGQVVLERRIPRNVRRVLESRGHQILVEEDWALGRLGAVTTEQESGLLRAGASPREMQVYAVGR